MFQLEIAKPLFQLKNDLLDFVYPQSCPICKEPLDREEKEVCENCWRNLAILPYPFCPYCKMFFEEEEAEHEHRCVSPNRFEDQMNFAVRSLGTFDDHYKTLIHRLKYEHKIPLGKRLAQRLGEQLTQDKDFINCDLVIPVPLHKSRQRQRGFNQSEILAEGVSQVTKIPLATKILMRKKNTKDQTHLDIQQRKENVKGAFAVTQPEMVMGKNVILVDDVITTGATLNECVRMLLDIGAKRVFAVTLAVVVE